MDTILAPITDPHQRMMSMSRTRPLRLSLAICLVVVLLGALAPIANARDALILRTSKPAGDPGLVEVVISAVSYDAAAGTIEVTATVECFSEAATLVVVDFTATQVQRGGTRFLQTFNNELVCNQTFTQILAVEEGFVSGPATIDVSALVCVLNCASETLRAQVILIP